LLANALAVCCATRVAAARVRFGGKRPATTGHADFERVFRAHTNMLEWLPSFLVPLWLCALYFSDVVAAALGLIWVGARILYSVGYSKAVEKRLPGIIAQTLVCALLFVGAVAGIILHWAG